MLNLLRYTLEWAGMLPLLALNNIVKDITYARTLGEWRARQASMYPAFVMLYMYVQYVHRRRPIAKEREVEAWGVGVWWAVLFAVFDAGMRTWQGATFQGIIEHYRLWEGELWPLWLVAVVCLPKLIQASRANGRNVEKADARDFTDDAGHPVHEETYFARQADDEGGETTVRARVRTTALQEGVTATEAYESVTYTTAG